MLRKELENFLKELSLSKRRSPATVDAYRRDLTPWVEFLEQKYNELPGTPHNDPLLLRVYLRDRGEKVSNRTLARFLSALSSFQRHLTPIRKAKPYLFALPRIRFSTPLPSFVPQVEAARLFEHGNARTDKSSYPYWRDYLMIALLYITGIRREELANIDLSDLDTKRGLLRVIGKGKKERTVPIGESSSSDIDTYLEKR